MQHQGSFPRSPNPIPPNTTPGRPTRILWAWVQSRMLCQPLRASAISTTRGLRHWLGPVPHPHLSNRPAPNLPALLGPPALGDPDLGFRLSGAADLRAFFLSSRSASCGWARRGETLGLLLRFPLQPVASSLCLVSPEGEEGSSEFPAPALESGPGQVKLQEVGNAPPTCPLSASVQSVHNIFAASLYFCGSYRSPASIDAPLQEEQ